MTEPKMTEPDWHPRLPATKPVVTTNTAQHVDLYTQWGFGKKETVL